MGHRNNYIKKDITGERFGKLVAIKSVEPVNHHLKGGKRKPVTRWLLKCDCGNLLETDLMHITRKKGGTKSCGCVGKTKLFKTKDIKHYRRLYNIWHKMKYRCFVPTSNDYQKYGGRGIIVCDRWLEFSLFYNDMVDTYQPGLTIERIDVNGNYEPGNCTWIPNKDQAKNRRTTIWINGLCAKDACLKAGINYRTFIQRRRCGKTIEQAFK
jgi:hypothetical protein